RDRIDWLKSGQGGLADELRGGLDLPAVADRALAFLTRYLGASAGTLYHAESDGVLHLIGSHAVASGEQAPPGIIRPGEGLVGQAALGRALSVVTGDAAHRPRIRSSLTEATPAAVVIIPLLHVGEVIGAVELALLEPWTDASRELVLLIRDTLAIALVVARSRDTLRQKNQELIAQATELDAQRRALEERNAELLDARHRLEQRAEEIATASTY